MHLQSSQYARLQPHLMSSLYAFEALARVVQFDVYPPEDRCHPRSAALGSSWIETNVWPQNWHVSYESCPLDVLFNCSLAWQDTLNASGTLRKHEICALLTSWCGVVRLYTRTHVCGFLYLWLHEYLGWGCSPSNGPTLNWFSLHFECNSWWRTGEKLLLRSA